MTRLSSNADLLKYLRELAGLLEKAGLHGEVEAIRFAISLAPAMSTEFLGESFLAMRKVAGASRVALTELQMNDIDRVAAQLEFALKRWSVGWVEQSETHRFDDN